MTAKFSILYIIACCLIFVDTWCFHSQFLPSVQNQVRFFLIEPTIQNFNTILDELLVFFTFINSFFAFVFKFTYQVLYEDNIVRYKDKKTLILQNSLTTKLSIHLIFGSAMIIFIFKSLLCIFNYLFPTEIMGSNGIVFLSYNTVKWNELFCFIFIAAMYYIYSKSSIVCFDKTQDLLLIDGKQICSLKQIEKVLIKGSGGRANVACIYLQIGTENIMLDLEWGILNDDFILKEIADFLKIESDNQHKFFAFTNS